MKMTPEMMAAVGGGGLPPPTAVPAAAPPPVEDLGAKVEQGVVSGGEQAKTTIASAFALATASGALAATMPPAPSFDTCQALSYERGASPGQGGHSTNPYAHYNTFMRECLEGKIPLSKSGF